MGEKLQEILAELRRGLEEIYGERLVKMVLFGSQARGDAENGSDIDVLVVLQDGETPEEKERRRQSVADLCLAHEVVIGCLVMDEGRFLHRQGPLLRNIRREGVLV